VPYAGESGNHSPDTEAESNPQDTSGFLLEGTMTIAEVAKALDSTTGEIIAKLGLPADIPVDKPLRDMKDQYGYSMPELKAKIKE